MAQSDDRNIKNDPAFEDREVPRNVGKERIPEHVEQRPGDEPIGNGQTNRPAAFPPHN